MDLVRPLAATTTAPARASARDAGTAAMLALLAIALVACPGKSQPAGEVRVEVDRGGSYVDVSPQRLATMLEAKDFTFVNVHVPYEGEIAGTDLFIRYDEIAGRQAELPAADDKIVLYCRSGSMSTAAAIALVRAGYTRIWNLAGGMNAWRAAGYPVAGAANGLDRD